MSKKIKVIYIVGTGHCGSTVLDLLLGAQDQIFSVGEIAFYNYFHGQKKPKKDNIDLRCTCRQKVKECVFWKKISPNFNIKKYFSLSENLKIISHLLFGLPLGIKDDSAKLYQQILEHNPNQVEWIVDSSKDPRRLLLLIDDPKIEVYPIFLIRKAAAVTNSYLKHQRSQSFLRYLFSRWFVVNLIADRVLDKSSRKMIIRYEDFCHDTRKYMQKINQYLETILETNIQTNIKRVNKEQYHDLGGNGLRLHQLKQIKASTTWRDKLTKKRIKFGSIFENMLNNLSANL